jgi:hypothetical protein
MIPSGSGLRRAMAMLGRYRESNGCSTSSSWSSGRSSSALIRSICSSRNPRPSLPRCHGARFPPWASSGRSLNRGVQGHSRGWRRALGSAARWKGRRCMPRGASRPGFRRRSLRWAPSSSRRCFSRAAASARCFLMSKYCAIAAPSTAKPAAPQWPPRVHRRARALASPPTVRPMDITRNG